VPCFAELLVVLHGQVTVAGQASNALAAGADAFNCQAFPGLTHVSPGVAATSYIAPSVSGISVNGGTVPTEGTTGNVITIR
jgi:hypothetical protein